MSRLQVVTIDAVEDVPPANETALMQAVTMHPTAIGLCVGPWIKEWRAYTGGILRVPGKATSEPCKLLQQSSCKLTLHPRIASPLPYKDAACCPECNDPALELKSACAKCHISESRTSALSKAQQSCEKLKLGPRSAIPACRCMLAAL